jgi:hypothetical protein
MNNQQPPWHFGLRYANQILNWLPSDTEEIFQKLMQNTEYVEYIRQQGWLEPGAITYNMNSHGFRCDDFDSQADSLVALGCSYSVGIGLPLKDIWPTLVGNELGLKVCNLSWGGIGADTCYRLAEYWIPELRPKLVVMLTPPRARIELLTIDSKIQAEVFLPMSESGFFSDQDVYLKHWFANEENSYINSRKNQRAVEHLCNELGIKCLTYDAHKFMARGRFEVGYARDYMHAGPKGHKIAFEQIIKDYYGR